MAWWFVAPLAIWGVKKIYDAVTDDDQILYISSSVSPLSSAMSTRTKLRETLIREAILTNRKLLISKTFIDNESVAIKLDGSSMADSILEASGLNVALNNLSNTVRLLNPSYGASYSEVDDCLLVFTDLNLEINNIVKRADDEYGSLAGIDHNNDYDSSKDPFVTRLQNAIST